MIRQRDLNFAKKSVQLLIIDNQSNPSWGDLMTAIQDNWLLAQHAVNKELQLSATGFAMTFYYRPTVAEAFASVEYIMTEVNYGWLFRSMHRWSASMMVLMMILHIFRVYLTGGFKKPRELTWVTGVTLAVVTVSFGVTGYSLPWDQVGYWACKIVTGVPEAIPVVGSLLVELLRGSVSVGQNTLTRFYSAHTFVLPVAAAVLMLTHFLMIRKQGISGPL